MIRVANAPCSWGVLEFDLEGKTAGFAEVLDEMRSTGYAGTELGDWGFMPTDPARLRSELEARAIELVGAFVPVSFSREEAHQAGLETALATARLMASAGCKEAFMVLSDDNGKVPQRTQNAGRVTPEMGLDERRWATFARGVEMVATRVREETGLRSVFHHHAAGYVETPAEIEQLLARTRGDLVGLALDTGHLSFGGGDPLDCLRRYFDRIWHVHFKDCSEELVRESRANGWDYFESVRAGIFCELGRGRVDFKSVANELRTRNYEGWIVVEQDVLPGMGSPEACARRNRQYLQTLGL
jgi:inosose dehydratase